MGTRVRLTAAAAAAAAGVGCCLAACGGSAGPAATATPASSASAPSGPPGASPGSPASSAQPPPSEGPLRPSGPAGQPAQLTVTEAETGRSVEMHAGDVLVVVLHGSAAAPWGSFASSNGAALRPDTSGVYGPPAGPGDLVAVLRGADRPGSSTITARRAAAGASFSLDVAVAGG